MRKHVTEATGDARWFIPFVVMHEFEGLLFSDCAALGSAIGRAELAARFEKIRAGFATPEDINDSPRTAPSKQVLRIFPAYQKVRHGEDAARAMGINRIREQCPVFQCLAR